MKTIFDKRRLRQILADTMAPHLRLTMRQAPAAELASGLYWEPAAGSSPARAVLVSVATAGSAEALRQAFHQPESEEEEPSARTLGLTDNVLSNTVAALRRVHAAAQNIGTEDRRALNTAALLLESAAGEVERMAGREQPAAAESAKEPTWEDERESVAAQLELNVGLVSHSLRGNVRRAAELLRTPERGTVKIREVTPYTNKQLLEDADHLLALRTEQRQVVGNLDAGMLERAEHTLRRLARFRG